MTETIAAAWIGSISTVAAGVAGAWLGAKISRDSGRNLLAQQARAEFSSTFTATLIELHDGPSDIGVGKAWELLKDAYRPHFAAYLKLRAIVPKSQRKAIDEAWKQYAKDDESQSPAEREFNRFGHVLSAKHDADQFRLAIKHINELLDAAT